MKNHYQKSNQILEKKVEVKVLEEVMVFNLVYKF